MPCLFSSFRNILILYMICITSKLLNKMYCVSVYECIPMVKWTDSCCEAQEGKGKGRVGQGSKGHL